jgi:hypothetical protein
MSTKSILSHLPKLAPLDTYTQALFQAIGQQDTAVVAAAIAAGANPNAIQPYFLSTPPDDIGGGMTPLQTVCSGYPQRPINLSILTALLQAGADANLPGELRESPLSVICQRLPSNAHGVIGLLVEHGAHCELAHLKTVMQARAMWIQDNRITPLGETATLDALWEHLPQEQRKQLDASWMMDVVPNDGEALSYAQIKMVQWLSNHCQNKPQLEFSERIQTRRTNEGAPMMGAPTRKLH